MEKSQPSRPACSACTTEVPALPLWKGDVNDVRLEPISVLSALAFGFGQRKGIAAQNVRDAIQPHLVGELVAIALSERNHPWSALKYLFGTQSLVGSHLIPQDGFVRPSVEAADGWNHADAQPLAANFEGRFQSKEADGFAGFPDLGPPGKSQRLVAVLDPIVLRMELFQEDVNAGVRPKGSKRLHELRLHMLDLLTLTLHVLSLRGSLQRFDRLEGSSCPGLQQIFDSLGRIDLPLLPETQHPVGLDGEVLQKAKKHI